MNRAALLLGLLASTLGCERVTETAGAYASSSGIAVTYPTGDGPLAVAAGDLNGDGLPDLAVANGASRDVTTLFNRGKGTFAAAVDYPGQSDARSVAAVDLTGDGWPEIVCVSGIESTVRFLRNQGHCIFAQELNYEEGQSSRSLSLARRVDARSTTSKGRAPRIRVTPATGPRAWPPRPCRRR
jgi:hypothetical protein